MTRSTAVLISLLLLGAPSAVRAQRAIDGAAIDSVIVREMRTRRIPGVAVAVVENGTAVFKRAYGTANLETGTPLTTNAVFELASVTKQFTAAGIMMLVEEGKVRLDDSVSTYIARTPPPWAGITVRQLLTHTAGLDIAALPRVGGAARLRITTAEAFDFVSQQPMRFPPGEHGWYSDAGYFLLGMIIEKASGQSYREFLRRRIFEPLHMSNSSVVDRVRVLERRVSTYGLRGDTLVNWRRDWDYELPSFFGIYSTLDDLAAWDASLRRATLLEPASLEQMWTPAKLKNGQDARVLDKFYGFGFELADLGGYRTVGHGGASGTYVLRFLDEPLTIVVLTNLEVDGAKRHPTLIARAVAGAVRPQYRPPHMLTAQGDPGAQITSTVQTLLTDIGARRESAVMTPGYRAWYQSSPGPPAWIASQLGGATALTYLGSAQLAGRKLWEGEPLDRLVHYSAQVKDRTMYFTVGLTADGKVGKLDFYQR